jgi:hypothetical protein
LLNKRASAMAPAEDPIQPSKLMLPYTASDAGSKKMPDPIMFPTTSDVLVHKPILPGGLGWIIRLINEF